MDKKDMQKTTCLCGTHEDAKETCARIKTEHNKDGAVQSTATLAVQQVLHGSSPSLLQLAAILPEPPAFIGHSSGLRQV